MIKQWAGDNELLFVAIKMLIAASVFLPAVNVIAIIAVWQERKIAGHMQSRLGPKHVGPFGMLQTIADGIKLLLKEDLIPRGADHFMFRLAPYLAFAPVFAAFLAVPFGPQLCFEASFNIGVLYLLAVLSVEVMGTILAGWGSNSKWAIYGAMREACQMVSYEIPLGISIICGLLVAGTLHMTQLNYLQGGGIWDWFVFHNPFIFCAFLIYFVASLASTKRAPFDLPESESELVAGFHTEYSGFRWMYFFSAEYGAMFIVGAIQAMLFMGGWNSAIPPIWFNFEPVTVPIIGWTLSTLCLDPVYWAIGYHPVEVGQAYFSGAIDAATTWGGKAQAMGISPFGLIVLNLYCLAWFVAKAWAVIFVHMWLRWTLPRIRIDQVLYSCVKVMLPASLVMLAGVAVWIAFVPAPTPPAGLPVHVGHLVGAVPWLQATTQVILMLLGLLIVASIVGVVLWTYIHRDKMPRKTLFPDVMPVGNEVHFTSGDESDAEPPSA